MKLYIQVYERTSGLGKEITVESEYIKDPAVMDVTLNKLKGMLLSIAEKWKDGN